MPAPRVVLTAIGAVTPLGLDWPSTWAALLAGTSGIGPLTLCDGSRLPPTVVAEVKGFDPDAVVGRKEARRMDRCSALAIAAAREAWASARLDGVDPARAGIVFGTAIGGFPMVEQQARTFIERGWDRVSPHFLANVLVDSPSGHVAIDLGARGPNFAVVSACSTGAHAIGVAADMLRRGEADVMLAGGGEACITELLLGGFHVMRALGTPRDPDDLASASRPFDATRNGFVIGETACLVVLEREDDARARGAEPIAELLAYGASNDAYHMVAPHPDGIGVVEMMRMALERAGVVPEDIGYVNAHGTSTPLNDRIETAAIRQVFGAHADRLAVSSTKSMTGHLLGGAGAVETAVCAMAVRDGMLPPTINLRERDPDCDLDYVSEGARRVEGLDVALSNSMGLGGHNGCTLVRRIEPAG
jgi:3-oxoacyl-[acyl-carrier-protein] synthase II